MASEPPLRSRRATRPGPRGSSASRGNGRGADAVADDETLGPGAAVPGASRDLRASGEATAAPAPAAAASRAVSRGPCFLVVRGPEPGRAFYLSDEARGPEGWVIGRRPGCAVALEGDPSVSRENAVVRKCVGGYEVVDLPQSRNGAKLNGKPMAKGLPYRLRAGDLLAVGNSVLAFEPSQARP